MPRFSAHLAFLYQEVPLLERPALAARDGFAAVDISEPTQVPLPELARCVRKAGVQVVQVSTSMGVREAGEMGLASLPDRQDEFRENCRALLEYATELGCTWVHPIAGIPAAGTPPGRAQDTYMDNVAFAADLFGARGIGTAVEPCNPTLNPGFHLQTLAQGAEVVDRLRDRGVRLMYDTFHMAMTGEDPVDGVRRHGADLGIVQVGDWPGRHEPGTGAIDFPVFFAALADCGYAGWVSCEYVPASGTSAGLGWRARYQ